MSACDSPFDLESENVRLVDCFSASIAVVGFSALRNFNMAAIAELQSEVTSFDQADAFVLADYAGMRVHGPIMTMHQLLKF